MRFKLTRLVFSIGCFACILAMPVAQAADGISGYFAKQSPLNAEASVKASAISQDDPSIPDWLKKSEKLEAMLSSGDRGEVKNPKVVSKVETPVQGLNGFVVQADIMNDQHPEGKQELFVFYTDKSSRYLFVGMLIDMEKERDLNLMTERYVRGTLADNPANALRPQGMHGLVVDGSKDSKAAPVQFVVDLGHESGRSSLLNVVRLQQSLVKSGKKTRGLRIVLVSAGKDEKATGAMAIAMGYQKVSGDGIQRLMEFAEKGKDTPWMEPSRLRKEAKLKQAMGLGIFQLEDNSNQAMLARLDTLPLVYDTKGESVKYVMLPQSRQDWETLLTR